MSDRTSVDTAESDGSHRSRRSLLYATSVLLVLMVIMSAAGHLLALQPAALVGFPVIIIGVTSLLLLLLYLVGPERQNDDDRVAAAVDHALHPAIGIEPQTGRIIAANERARDLVGPAHLSHGSHLADVLSERSSDECHRIIRNTLDHGEFEAQVCAVRTRSDRPAVVQLTARLVELDRSSFVLIGLTTNEVNAAVAEFARIQERLMSNISHELRTPLNVVMGFSELLITGTLGEMPDNQLDAAEECHEGGERMLRLINDILDVGRSRSYYLETETGPLSPSEMIQRVANLLSGQARREELALALDLDADLPVIESEERAFKQLVYHLILHGMSRSLPGGTVRIEAHRDDDQLLLSISDQGDEITEDVRPQPVPTLSETDATGTLAPPLLGLPLCATLAERLGAALSTDHDGDGTHVVVAMPLLRF